MDYAKLLKKYLDYADKKQASDLHLKSLLPAAVRVFGELENIDEKVLSPEEVSAIADVVLTEENKAALDTSKDVDMSFSLDGKKRYRCNAYYDRNGLSLAIRQYCEEIQDFEKLGIPELLKRLCLKRSGLILITGPTGSGKTTLTRAFCSLIREYFPDSSILLVDNDLSCELAGSFGLKSRNTIYGIRSGKHEYKTGIPSRMTKQEYIEWALEDILVEVEENVDLLVSWLVPSKDCRCPITGLMAEAVEKLFGKGAKLTQKRPLSQPGEFLSDQRVKLVTAKGEIANVAVLGPERQAVQVELSLTDARVLGIKAPVNLSGDLNGAFSTTDPALTSPGSSFSFYWDEDHFRPRLRIDSFEDLKTAVQLDAAELSVDGEIVIAEDFVLPDRLEMEIYGDRGSVTVREGATLTLGESSKLFAIFGHNNNPSSAGSLPRT